MALSKTPRTIVTSASNSAGGTTRGTLDLKTTYGGFLTIKMTTGGTGPSAQCVCNVMVAHNSTLPFRLTGAPECQRGAKTQASSRETSLAAELDAFAGVQRKPFRLRSIH